MTITVVNKRNKVPGAIYCGRGSPLGNPFVMSRESQRDEVCEKYHEYFLAKVKEQGPLRSMVINLFRRAQGGEDLKLECYCAPKRCHCDTVKKFIEDHLHEY